MGNVIGWIHHTGGAGVVMTDIACGGFHVLALANDGRVFAWGMNHAGQLGIFGLTTGGSDSNTSSTLSSSSSRLPPPATARRSSADDNKEEEDEEQGRPAR